MRFLNFALFPFSNQSFSHFCQNLAPFSSIFINLLYVIPPQNRKNSHCALRNRLEQPSAHARFLTAVLCFVSQNEQTMISSRGRSLFELLQEADLSHFYNELRSSLRVCHVQQLKDVTEEDLTSIGMSKHEAQKVRNFLHFEEIFGYYYINKNFVKFWFMLPKFLSISANF